MKQIFENCDNSAEIKLDIGSEITILSEYTEPCLGDKKNSKMLENHVETVLSTEEQ